MNFVNQAVFSHLVPSQSKLNMESLTKPELLMLFSILEGELEARDMVIDALKVLVHGAANVTTTPKLLPAQHMSRFHVKKPLRMLYF